MTHDEFKQQLTNLVSEALCGDELNQPVAHALAMMAVAMERPEIEAALCQDVRRSYHRLLAGHQASIQAEIGRLQAMLED